MAEDQRRGSKKLQFVDFDKPAAPSDARTKDDTVTAAQVREDEKDARRSAAASTTPAKSDDTSPSGNAKVVAADKSAPDKDTYANAKVPPATWKAPTLRLTPAQLAAEISASDLAKGAHPTAERPAAASAKIGGTGMTPAEITAAISASRAKSPAQTLYGNSPSISGPAASKDTEAGTRA